MALVIKKTVNLESLGEEYKGIVLNFRSIPAADMPTITEKTDSAEDNLASLVPLFLEIITEYFIDGQSSDGKVTKEDIKSLDSESVILCFRILTGQGIDPKAKNESTSTSTTESAEV